MQSEQSQQFVRDLGLGIKHYGYNTLVFSDNMKKFGMSYISAFPMEEITLIDFNKNNPPTPLVAIYPKEGSFWHDDPFIVMASATSAEQQGAQQFYDYLLSDESQKLAMSFGFRPANVNVPLADPISAAYGVQPQGVQNILEIPAADVIVAAKNSWAQNRKRRRHHARGRCIGLDGGRQAGARKGWPRQLPPTHSARGPGGADHLFERGHRGGEGRAAQREPHRAPKRHPGHAAPPGRPPSTTPSTWARKSLDALPDAGADRIRGIVLLTDGADNASKISLDQLASSFDETGISIFPVGYDIESDAQAKTNLGRIAEFSRTILVNGGTGDIAEIFQNLSRYF